MAQFVRRIENREMMPTPGDIWVDRGGNEVIVVAVEFSQEEDDDVVVFDRRHTHLDPRNTASLGDFMFDFTWLIK